MPKDTTPRQCLNIERGETLYFSENPIPSGIRNRTAGSDIGKAPRDCYKYGVDGKLYRTIKTYRNIVSCVKIIAVILNVTCNIMFKYHAMSISNSQYNNYSNITDNKSMIWRYATYLSIQQKTFRTIFPEVCVSTS